MKVAYIVSAYKLPQQLVRLVRRLHTENATFAIHVDAKTSRQVYGAMVDGTRELDRVFFVERHRCHWGGWGHVRATLKGMERLYSGGAEFEYAVLLTGQDYPLRSARAIEGFLAGSGGRSYMSRWRLPSERWPGRGGLDRLERRHLVGPRHLHVVLPGRRRLPLGLEPWGGSPYWCLARPALDHVRAVVGERRDVVRFFERAYIPDELFFQTILMSSTLAETVVDSNVRYLDWSRRPAPAILGVGDLEAMFASGALFARKFDFTLDGKILDLLDERLERESAPALP
jgi:hypothetical protein